MNLFIQAPPPEPANANIEIVRNIADATIFNAQPLVGDAAGVIIHGEPDLAGAIVLDFHEDNFVEPISDSMATMLLSEDVLRRDWDTPEEDEAWAHL